MSKVAATRLSCACILFCILISISASAQTFTNLLSFRGANGANPYTALVQGSDGNLYGTTIDGGANSGGNVFAISLSGALTKLYSFCSKPNCVDGQYPVATLIAGSGGGFYGTTQSGGASNYGTIFKITRSGTLTTLHSFNGDDGAAPYGSLLLASDGNFYGTANVGGLYGSGTIFRMAPDGRLSTLYNFCAQAGCPDGQYPLGELIQATDGNIYGVTHAGGNAACFDGCGTIFKMTLSGTLTTLHMFDDSDGEYPYGGLVEAGDGMFYGTTGAGGPNTWGTVYSMTSSGTLTTLHGFDGSDGSNPYSVMLGSDGNLYGTTSTGDPRNNGTIFEVTPSGTFTTLHDFHGNDGKLVYSGLMQDTNGIFYGTTYFGGVDNDGTVFSLSVGLDGSVKDLPAPGK